MGETSPTLSTRYDQGPSRREPSRPIVCLRAGRTSITDVVPVTPKTQIATAASVGSFLQCGRSCMVHAQNRSLSEVPLPSPPAPVRSRRFGARSRIAGLFEARPLRLAMTSPWASRTSIVRAESRVFVVRRRCSEGIIQVPSQSQRESQTELPKTRKSVALLSADFALSIRLLEHEACRRGYEMTLALAPAASLPREERHAPPRHRQWRVERRPTARDESAGLQPPLSRSCDLTRRCRATPTALDNTAPPRRVCHAAPSAGGRGLRPRNSAAERRPCPAGAGSTQR